MEKIKLDVLIYEESGNWSSWPQAITSDNSNLCIRLFCALNSPKSEKTNALCSSLKEQGKITEYELFSCHGKNFMQRSNELFLTPDEDYILFLSASIAPR